MIRVKKKASTRSLTNGSEATNPGTLPELRVVTLLGADRKRGGNFVK